MRKFLILFAGCFTSFVSLAQPGRNWDKPMELQKCLINISADLFTATTFIEMEFYNPNDQEIEGLYQFQLQPGQAVTALQLDLFGKFRDGTIEEKWKAQNAYNTIVGKRVDPALLTMETYNNYSLRIYPIAARSTRRITMTIQQLLKTNGETIDYLLPLTARDKLKQFSVDINVYHTSARAFVKDGLLKGMYFSQPSSLQQLKFSAHDYNWNKQLLFSIPLLQKDAFCVKQQDDKAYYALRHFSSAPKIYPIQPKTIAVFWDISLSGSKRNTEKEISFLKQYIAYHGITELTITPFNHKPKQNILFSLLGSDNSKWISYLRSLSYEGATQLSSLDFSSANADVIFLVSDGYNSIGSALPKKTNALVFGIHASETTDNVNLNSIIGNSGGKNIDLLKQSVSEAIALTGVAQNNLLNIRSSSGKTIIDVEWHNEKKNESFLSGTMKTYSDTLIFEYGNNNRIAATEKIVISQSSSCGHTAIHRIPALIKFDELLQKQNWQELLFFGKEEGIVTYRTAYIVLEKAEDYVNFNIEPPKEMEQECEKLSPGFLVRNAKSRAERMTNARQLTEFDILSGVARIFNERIRRWGNAEQIVLQQPPMPNEKMTVDKTSVTAGTSKEDVAFFRPDFEGNSAMSEVVVVTGYASARRKQSFSSTTAIVRGSEIFNSATSVEQALSGRVPGLMVTPGNGVPGSVSSIRIRGNSSLSGDSQPLYVLDGLPVSGNSIGHFNINDYVSVHDIDYIEVLRDINATALYGSRGANGVIVIQTKKGKANNWGYNGQPYKLKSMEDVEYLQEIKRVSKEEKMAKYRELQPVYANDAGFYLDMAQHLYESGFKEKAIVILTNAAELLPNNLSMQRTVAFFLEQWGELKEAIHIYEQILKASPANLMAFRDLALAYSQNGEHQKAIETLYEAIKYNLENAESAYTPVKEILLNDMNAIIAMHKNDLDLDAIPKEFIKSLPVDLRIIIEGNGAYFYNARVIEPGNNTANEGAQPTKHGGYFTQNYYQYNSKEYQLKNAVKGKYKIRVTHYDHNKSVNKQPALIRITVYRNFGKANQTMVVENVIMDNQNGEVEIAEVKL